MPYPAPVWPSGFQNSLAKEVSESSIEAACRLLWRRATELQAMGARRRAEALGRFTSRWLDPAYPWRRRAVERIAAGTGFSTPVLHAGLDALFGAWSTDAMLGLLEREFGQGRPVRQDEGGVGSLDLVGESPRAGKDADGTSRWLAIPPRVTGHILAGNVPPPTLQSLLSALLVGAPSFLKPSREEPWFGTLLVQSLQAEEPALGRCTAAVCWPRAEQALTDALLRSAELIVVHGGDRTVEAVRARLPVRTRLIPHGHGLSVGYVAREVLEPRRIRELASALAQDMGLFDQHGCLSPQTILVETGGAVTPERLAQVLANQALPALETSWPSRHLPLEDAARVLQFKGVQALSGTVFPAGTGVVAVSEASRFSSPCPGRSVFVRPVDTLEDALAYLEPVIGSLQGVALAAPQERWTDLATAFAQAGATRVCRPGTLQAPPALWPADGIRPLGAFVRWTSLEMHPDYGSV